MKKKGFTLIELLGVVIILAALSLVVFPILLNQIKESKGQISESAKKIVLNSAKLYFEENRDLYKPVNGKTYCVSFETLAKNDYIDKSIINLDGEKFQNQNDTLVEINNVTGFVNINYINDTAVYEVVNKCPSNYNNGDIVYYDVNTGKSCNNYHDDNSKTGYNGTNESKTTDNQNSCLKFYAFNDEKDNTKVNLLLDHNTTAIIKWNASNTNATGPDDALKTQLANDTTGWVAEQPSAYEGIGYNNSHYTITYNTNARLITANEIAKITDYDEWDSVTSSNYFYFDGHGITGSSACRGENKDDCIYGWLYDRTSTICKDEYGCSNDAVGANTYGYWTASAIFNNSSSVWYVYHGGSLYDDDARINNYGIRPVIEVIKSNL